MSGNNKQTRQAAEKIGTSNESLAVLLKAAQPRLIVRVVPDPCNKSKLEITPYIREVDAVSEVVIREGYDPDHSPLGPVYWRIVKRGDQRLYLSTYRVMRDEIIKGWGTPRLAYCDPLTGMAIARVRGGPSMTQTPRVAQTLRVRASFAVGIEPALARSSTARAALNPVFLRLRGLGRSEGSGHVGL
jgi:hypothetical protein